MRNGILSLNYSELSSLLSRCGRRHHLLSGASIHAFILKNPTFFTFHNHPSAHHRHAIVLWNSIIAMYSKCGSLHSAAKVFDEMPVRDTVSWNSMISGFLSNDELQTGFLYFKTMLGSNIYRLDHATITTMLSVCDAPELVYISSLMHALIVSYGFEQMVSVRNALITTYFKCESHVSAKKVFDEMCERNVITWTAMVSGLAQSQMLRESFTLFREMRRCLEANELTYSSSLQACSGMQTALEGQQVHGLVLKSGCDSDLCVQSAVMDMYSKRGLMEDAYCIFEQSCQEPDEVFLTVILVGFAQNGLEERAFELFAKIFREGIGIDANMVSAVLGAYGSSTPFALGKQIHAFCLKKCFEANVFVSNGLINMYSKCGELRESVKAFDLMVHKNPVSWNSVIAAVSRHGHGNEALQYYEHMRSEGMEPTDITFLSLLHACSHIGAVEKGIEFINSMSLIHRIAPRIEHYACVVDMLGRAGFLDEAKRFIDRLPIEPTALVWQALLGACSTYANSEVGEYAAQRLLLVEPDSAAAYVLLANIYSSQRRWKKRAEVITRMKEMKVKKDVGISWIEIEKDVHSFVVEDKVHPQAEIIYDVLSALAAIISDQELVKDGYILNSMETLNALR